MDKSDFFMQAALNEARIAETEGEVPIGAVLVCNDRIISKAHNQTEKLNDATAHAEMLAITSAMSALSSKYLPDCSLFVSLEPCVMCAGAIAHAKIKELHYATSDPKTGYTNIEGRILHPSTKIFKGVLKDESAKLLKDFFKKRR